MAEENNLENKEMDLSGVESRLDSLDQTLRMLVSEVVQIRSQIDNALD